LSKLTKPALKLPEFIALFAAITSMTAISIDAMLPALDAIGQSLQVLERNDTQLVISALILGMVIGELVFGPLSDSFGRKRPIMIGIGVYALGAAIAMLAVDLEQLLLGRFIQGIGVSGPKIVSRAMIRDQFEGPAMARITSFVMMVFILVPMLAPALGQLILWYTDWRGIFAMFLVFALVISLWFGTRQPETLTVERRLPLSISQLWSSCKIVFGQPRVMAYATASGMLFGALLVYLATAQALFTDLYQRGDEFVLYFALLASGIAISSFINGKLVMRYGVQRLAIIGLCGMLLASGWLLVSALPNQGIPSFASFLGCCFFLFFFIGVLFGNLNALAMQPLGAIAGLGASVIAAISSLIAVLFSVVTGRLYDGDIYPLAGAFLFAASMALLLVWLARPAKT